LGDFHLLPQQDLAQLDVLESMLHIDSKSHNLQTRPQFNPTPQNLCFSISLVATIIKGY